MSNPYTDRHCTMCRPTLLDHLEDLITDYDYDYDDDDDDDEVEDVAFAMVKATALLDRWWHRWRLQVAASLCPDETEDAGETDQQLPERRRRAPYRYQTPSMPGLGL